MKWAYGHYSLCYSMILFLAIILGATERSILAAGFIGIYFLMGVKKES